VSWQFIFCQILIHIVPAPLCQRVDLDFVSVRIHLKPRDSCTAASLKSLATADPTVKAPQCVVERSGFAQITTGIGIALMQLSERIYARVLIRLCADYLYICQSQ
jgi:hypothetical protein